MSKKKSDEHPVIETTVLEVYEQAYAEGISVINELTKMIVEDYRSKGDIAINVAKEMARDRYLIGSAFLNAKKENLMKVQTMIVERKEKVRQERIETERKENQE